MAIWHLFICFAVVSSSTGLAVNEMQIDVGPVFTPSDETTCFKDQGESNVGKFSWSRCNVSVVPVAVSSFCVTPDPIQFGQNLTVSGLTVYVGEQLPVKPSNKVKADMQVMMKLDTQEVDICIYRPENCHLDDVCGYLKKEKSIFNCPFAAMTYTPPLPLTFQMPTPQVTLSGKFDLTLRLTEVDNQNLEREIGCVNVQFCIGQC